MKWVIHFRKHYLILRSMGRIDESFISLIDQVISLHTHVCKWTRLFSIIYLKLYKIWCVNSLVNIFLGANGVGVELFHQNYYIFIKKYFKFNEKFKKINFEAKKTFRTIWCPNLNYAEKGVVFKLVVMSDTQLHSFAQLGNTPIRDLFQYFHYTNKL